MEQDLAKLTTNERILVNTEIEKNCKNSTTAWLLWWFTGTLGGHRYYMGKTGTAITMTILTITIIGIIISGPWALIDVFFISKWLKQDKEKIEKQAIQNILLYRH
ncbi:TM2 domain-containing protein [Enterococcus faecalis]|uniref:NINE protein n=1 Tax=Enterococcus faecalis TaxID=1351 RepID=UPI0017848ED4|nr:TM2 domain-containing protein [Enterococcus faecalis]MBD9846440.1 TM2 domain-containing protein [Enterococcus faecalis]